MKNVKKNSLAVTLGAVVIGTAGLASTPAAANPFEFQDMAAGYQLDAGEGKCGGKAEKEGKCGEAKKAAKEGKCGEGKCGEAKKAAKEGKCGEGKCGEAKMAEKAAKKAAKEGKCGEGKAKKEGKCGSAH